jgi:hypothetical protein
VIDAAGRLDAGGQPLRAGMELVIEPDIVAGGSSAAGPSSNRNRASRGWRQSASRRHPHTAQGEARKTVAAELDPQADHDDADGGERPTILSGDGRREGG